MAAACPSHPVVTWDSWGRGFFTTWCGACHAATTPDRRGAPDGVTFDSAAQVWSLRDRISARVLDDQTMPVGGGLGDDEREMLASYLACEDGTTSDTLEPSKTDVPLTVEDVERRAANATELGLPRAETIWLGYLQLLNDHGQVNCPFGWQFNLREYQSPMEGCTTDAGWIFSGLTQRKETVDLDGAYEWMLGDSFVETPEGEFGSLAGEIAWWKAAGGTPRTFWQTVDGTWGWPWVTGWLGAVPSTSLAISGSWDGPKVVAQVDGGLSINAASIYFQALTVETAVCAKAPTGGTVLVRDDAGFWYPITLRHDCSGCGDAANPDGEALGEVCIDWGTLIAGLGEIPT